MASCLFWFQKVMLAINSHPKLRKKVAATAINAQERGWSFNRAMYFLIIRMIRLRRLHHPIWRVHRSWRSIAARRMSPRCRAALFRSAFLFESA
jgi:hypothetical protein